MKKHIVCFGDSNTHGYNGDTLRSYAFFLYCKRHCFKSNRSPKFCYYMACDLPDGHTCSFYMEKAQRFTIAYNQKTKIFSRILINKFCPEALQNASGHCYLFWFAFQIYLRGLSIISHSPHSAVCRLSMLSGLQIPLQADVSLSVWVPMQCEVL